MKKVLLSLLLVVFIGLPVIKAQSVSLPYSLRKGAKQEKSSQNERVYDFFVGGNINSNFAHNLAIMPEVGITFKDKMFALGIGPRYELSYFIGGYNNTLSHCFGASAFGEVTIFNYLILHAGYEFLNYPIEVGADLPERHNVHAVAAGIGFNSNTMMSDRISLYAMYVLYPYHTDRVFEFYGHFPMFARIGVRITL